LVTVKIFVGGHKPLKVVENKWLKLIKIGKFLLHNTPGPPAKKVGQGPPTAQNNKNPKNGGGGGGGGGPKKSLGLLCVFVTSFFVFWGSAKGGKKA